MRCHRVRDQLVRQPDRRATTLREHLEGCPECAAFAEHRARLARATTAHHADVSPPPDFAARVVARLPARAEGIDDFFDPLAWAALRMLPVATALALVLGTWWLVQPPAAGFELLLAAPWSEDSLLALLMTVPEAMP